MYLMHLNCHALLKGSMRIHIGVADPPRTGGYTELLMHKLRAKIEYNARTLKSELQVFGIKNQSLKFNMSARLGHSQEEDCLISEVLKRGIQKRFI